MIQPVEGGRVQFTVSRRELLIGGGVLAGAAVAGLVVGSVANEHSGALERQRKWERDHTLSSKASTPSSAGWSIRHPEPEVILPQLVQVHKYREEFSGLWLPGTTREKLLNFDNSRRGAAIVFGDYTRSDGVAAPKLIVYLNEHIEQIGETRIEEWIWGDPPTEQSEGSPVILENGKSGEVLYLTFKKAKSKEPVYDIVVSKPVVTS